MSGTGVTTVQTALSQLCRTVEGLQSIIVTDRDGVIILQAPAPTWERDPNAEQILTTIFSFTTEQTSKISELGEANFIMTTFDSCICLQVNAPPLVIHMAALPDANAGMLIDLLPIVKNILGPTKDVIMRETDQY
eukprot:NODE_18344_length_897_cov_4.180519.p2 GENE.NODE_18344_length_897_cov_4.180519~~NODE_18344_length_897_cov_4.180519.p2  ORF type:complete len:135 (-),score=40.59 NODE_18344_length_897_cov_4.180519:298-702(-)